ncbi:MAG: methyltransferase domain-containing protein [Deltaproteobacteria bacterium]|nr:methyltransferase domain-containing protein [Deltaproteobacteria bacterium]
MDRELLKNFWDKKAPKYPLPFDQGSLKNTIFVIDKLRVRGVFFSGKKILDIGCGTGIYTLPLASEARLVCGIDCSCEMLSILKNQAERHGLENIVLLNYFWEDVDPKELGFTKKFDIVMAMMTPAVKSVRDILKMEDCSKEWLIYMGWGKRKNHLMEKIFAMHGIEWNFHSPAFSICLTLEKLRRRFHVEFFEYSWDFWGTLEEALDDLCCYIRLYGKNPRKEKIFTELKRHFGSNMVSHRTDAEVALITWKVQLKEGV